MAKDRFHDAVKIGLQKAGWQITHDPLYINIADVEIYIDLGAERLLAAEKDGEKIAIEIKTFLNPSAISEFHTVLGQFLNYRLALKLEEPNRMLYLAIPQEAWNSFFKREFARLAIAEHQLKLLIFDVSQEVILQWQN